MFPQIERTTSPRDEGMRALWEPATGKEEEKNFYFFGCNPLKSPDSAK
jgi:hypothetical protein